MKANSLRLLGTAVFAFLFLVSNQPRFVRAAGPWYVTPSGNDSNDCTSPASACASINGALNQPGFVVGDTINVSAGTYLGTGTQVVSLNKSATLSGGWDASFAANTIFKADKHALN